MGMGGFGATEVIYLLEKEGYQLPDEPKVLIGFSDVTKLFLYVLKKGWNVLHAPMVAFCQDLAHISKDNVNKEVTYDVLMNVITGKTTELTYQLDVLNNPILIENTSIVGGNLSLVAESLGTDISPDLCGRILFIEDTVEDGKRFERKFLNLLQNQALDGCLAIFIGNQNLSAGQDLKRLIKDMISSFGITIPILYSSDFGHGPKNNVLPMGTKARLESSDDGKTALLIISVNDSYQQDN
jgi:muramoyltetrapeptide carboxypeptidase